MRVPLPHWRPQLVGTPQAPAPARC
jgi:hypothetical protein